MSEELKPCPFCGGSNISVIQGSTFRWRLAECDCGARAGEVRIQTMGDGTQAQWEAQAAVDAIKEWNTRATPGGMVLVDRNKLFNDLLPILEKQYSGNDQMDDMVGRMNAIIDYFAAAKEKAVTDFNLFTSPPDHEEWTP